ncbi:hypothetical protein DSM100685_1453 [Bifidobacterium avesanii]|nr:hypothetical protein DSM100685_1453 [Bifidobacterium avesanii]
MTSFRRNSNTAIRQIPKINRTNRKCHSRLPVSPCKTPLQHVVCEVFIHAKPHTRGAHASSTFPRTVRLSQVPYARRPPRHRTVAGHVFVAASPACTASTHSVYGVPPLPVPGELAKQTALIFAKSHAHGVRSRSFAASFPNKRRNIPSCACRTEHADFCIRGFPKTHRIMRHPAVSRADARHAADSNARSFPACSRHIREPRADCFPPAHEPSHGHTPTTLRERPPESTPSRARAGAGRRRGAFPHPARGSVRRSAHA